MIFNKVITGNVLSYENVKEIKVPGEYIYEFESDIAEVEDAHQKHSYYDEYYYVYEKLSIQYYINNVKKEIVFNRVYLNREVKKTDLVRLRYNRFTKKVVEILG